MMRLFKKRMQDILDNPKHKSYVPKDAGDPVYNLSELVALSQRYGSGFKVIGDHQKFTIVSKNFVLIGIVVMILVYLAFTSILAITTKEPILWFITVGKAILFVLALKAGPLLFYNITVDSHKQKITVKSNNTLGFIGKWIRPGFEINFNRFEKLSGEGKVRKSWGGEMYTTHYVIRIFMEYDQQKRPVIEFKDEINHRIFIICLTRLIKNNIGH